MEPINLPISRIKKKILFIHQNLIVGGAEELRLTLLKHINRDKFDITVCNIENNGVIGEEIEKLGFSVINLNRRCVFWDIRIILDLYKLIKKKHYDIVQTSLFYANLHGRIAAYLAKTPVIISEEHSIYEWKARHPIFILADKILSKITNRIIACSNSVKEFTIKQEKIPADKFITIHNCIDINKFSIAATKEQLREHYGFSKDEKIVIIVGSLREQKGHKYLLEAFARVKEAIPESKLLIIGSGPEEYRLRNLSKKFNITNSVVFMGIRRDIPQLLKMSDLFVLPSLREGFGIVLLEAMVSGLAIVATAVDGILEVVVEGETGILVPPSDAKALADSIVTILSDEIKRIEFGVNAKKRVKSDFTPEKYIEKLTQLYEDK